MKNILIVDDSALMRRVLSDIINTDEEDTEVIYNNSYDICTNVLTRRGFKIGYFYKVENLQEQK